MATNINQMLIKLSQDSELMAQFTADPAAVMNSHEVSAEDQATILSGDADQIAKAVGHEHAADNNYGFDAFI